MLIINVLAIESRLDIIKNLQNVRCRSCSNRKKGKENRNKIRERVYFQMKYGNWVLNSLTQEQEIKRARNFSITMKKKYASGELKVWNDGIHIQTNTGRTHIKKGQRLSPETEFKSGKEHFLWKGGIGIPRGHSWNKIRKSIFKRDGYKCRYCDNNQKLSCHHIIPYMETEDNSKENLIILCNVCHPKLERIYDDMCKRPYYFEIINSMKSELLYG